MLYVDKTRVQDLERYGFVRAEKGERQIYTKKLYRRTELAGEMYCYIDGDGRFCKMYMKIKGLHFMPNIFAYLIKDGILEAM